MHASACALDHRMSFVKALETLTPETATVHFRYLRVDPASILPVRMVEFAT